MYLYKNQLTFVWFLLTTGRQHTTLFTLTKISFDRFIDEQMKKQSLHSPCNRHARVWMACTSCSDTIIIFVVTHLFCSFTSKLVKRTHSLFYLDMFITSTTTINSTALAFCECLCMCAQAFACLRLNINIKLNQQLHDVQLKFKLCLLCAVSWWWLHVLCVHVCWLLVNWRILANYLREMKVTSKTNIGPVGMIGKHHCHQRMLFCCLPTS